MYLYALNIISFQLLDYQIFTMLVKQGPVKFTRAPPLFRHKLVRRKDFRKLPEEVKAELREDIELLHDRMFQVMRDMPSSLILIFRYFDH